MMLIVQIRLTSHWLGELPPDSRGIRKFKRDRQNRMAVNSEFWRDRFSLAARELGLHVDIRNAIVPPTGVLLPSVHLHRRTYSQNKVDLFESFRTGTVLTFDLRLDESRQHCPTMEQLGDILKMTGEWLGLSPWGSDKYGYGRFLLLRITRAGNPQQSWPASQEHEPGKTLPEASGDAAHAGDVVLTRASA